MYEIFYTKRAVKQIPLLKAAKLDGKAQKLIELIANDPFCSPPEYEKLALDLKGAYSRRINRQHRLIYEVLKEEKKIKIISMWTHYDI